MNFEQLGYFKDYYRNGKYIGSVNNCQKDREHFGYSGRINEVTQEPIYLSNKRIIKAGEQVVTELQIICGKRII